MKYTNENNLPASLVNAIKNINEDYEKVGKYSITQLIQPPQVNTLISRHMKDITSDIGDEIFKIFGSAVHYILERSNKNNEVMEMIEKRITMKVGGIVISGKMDLYDPIQMHISDYKTTSVYKIMKKDYSDWITQLSDYRLLLLQNGYVAQTAEVIALLRDFSKSKAKLNPEYPRCGAATVPIPLNDPLEQMADIALRIGRFEKASRITDEKELSEIYPCTPEQQWKQQDKIAVYSVKDGKKGVRAFRVVDTMEEATAITQGDTSKFTIEERTGERTRCEEWCLAQPFCMQYRREHVNTTEVTASEIDKLLEV